MQHYALDPPTIDHRQTDKQTDRDRQIYKHTLNTDKSVFTL